MDKGEVRLLTIFLAAGAEEQALGDIRVDTIVQVSSPVTSGVWIGTRRSDVRRGDSRSQVFDVPKRIRLGETQRLWIRNETQAPIYVSLEFWLNDGSPV